MYSRIQSAICFSASDSVVSSLARMAECPLFAYMT